MAPISKSLLMDKLRASNYERDYFEREYDYSTGAYGGRPSRRDSMEYGLRVIQHHAEMVEARYKQNGGGDLAERELSRAATEVFHRMCRSHDGLSREAEERRQENRHLSDVISLLGAGPTTVRLVWTQEMEDWCKEQVTGQYQIARHGIDAYFVFESVDQAAIFKLLWA